MAAESGCHPDRLVEELCSEPWKHDFFQAVRRIECAYPELPRIGKSKRLRHDPVRFGQFVSLAFATSALERGNSPDDKQTVAVRFTGLTGPNGPLPLRMTEFIRNRLRGVYDPDLRGSAADTSAQYGIVSPRDSTLAEFLDVFHHRMISLFYRAWAAAEKTVDFDRESDRIFAEWIASTCGLGLPEFDGLDSIPTWNKVAFAGHLGHQTRPVAGLRGILAEAFRFPAEVISLVGHWVAIPKDQQCRLGESPDTGRIGSSCVVGSKIWDRRLKIFIRLGPMSLRQYESFLPGYMPAQMSLFQLRDWVALHTRREFYWDAAIILKKEEVPKISLGRSGRLGYTCWLSSVQFSQDPEDYKIRGGSLNPSENT